MQDRNPIFWLKIFFFSAILSLIASSAMAQELTRDELISQRLDCFSRLYNTPGIDWETVCAISISQDEEIADEEIVEGEASEEPEQLARLNVWPFKKAQSQENQELEEVVDEEQIADSDSIDYEPTEKRSWWKIWPPERNPDRQLEFALDISDWEYNWRKSLNVNYNGQPWGFAAAYTYRTRENEQISSFIREAFTKKSNVNVFNIEVKMTGANVEYEQAGPAGKDFLDWTVEGRALAGYEFPFGEKTVLTPYMGGGYYFRRSEFGQAMAFSYDEMITFYYLPMGSKFKYELNDSWDLGLRVEYDFLYYARQDTQYKDADSRYENPKFEFNTGYGYKISGRVVKKQEAIDFFIEPYFEYWKLKKSTIKDIVYNGSVLSTKQFIPENETIQWGLRLGIIY